MRAMIDRVVTSHRIRRDLVEALRLAALRSGHDQRHLIEKALEAMIDPGTLAEGAELAARRLAEERQSKPSR